MSCNKIGLKVGFTTLYYIFVVFEFMRSIAFLTFRPICLVCKYSMFPFSAVFVLRDAWIYISFSDSGNILTNVKTSVYKHFCFHTVLKILNVNPYDSHIWFGKCFDNM